VNPIWRFVAPLLWPLLSAESAQITRFEGSVHIKGKITSGDAGRLKEVIRFNDRIVLNSQGGDALEGLHMYSVIKSNHARVLAPRSLFERCQSACAIAGLGGRKITGRLSFHLPRLKYSEGDEEAKKLLVWLRRAYLKVIRLELGQDAAVRVASQTSRTNFYAVDFYSAEYKLRPTQNAFDRAGLDSRSRGLNYKTLTNRVPTKKPQSLDRGFSNSEGWFALGR